MANSNLGVVTAGNLVLSGANGSINFLSSLNTTPNLGVLSTLFNKSFALESGSDDFDTYVQNGSSVTRDTNKDYLSLRAPNSGSSAILQTKQYIVSSTGSSRIVSAVSNLDPLNVIPSNPGLFARVGSFDSATQKTDSARGDGYFFSYSSNGLSVVRRSSNSGVDIDEVIPQSQWNLDHLDGNGPSQYTLSPTRANVFLLVYQQTGYASSVKLGIVAGTNVVFAHRFDQKSGDANAVRTTSLPVRFELTNASGNNNLVTELRAISCSVTSSGGPVEGVRRSCGLKAEARDVNLSKLACPVLSVRLKTAFARASARLVGLHLTTTTAVYYEIVQNGALTGSVWTDSSASSITEFDKDATTITGGKTIQSGYCGERETLNLELPVSLTPLASTIPGVCDIFTLNVVCLMASGLCWANLDISEIA